MQQIVLILSLTTIITGNSWDCGNYYWRDFHGFLPRDAFPSAVDANGNPLYVGKAYVTNRQFLTAEIFSVPSMVAEITSYTDNINITDNYLILCSKKRAELRWFNIHSSELQDYNNKFELIPGGDESVPLWIGRILVNGTMYIGKVFADNQPNRGLWYAIGNAPRNSLNYDVLGYNCECKTNLKGR